MNKEINIPENKNITRILEKGTDTDWSMMGTFQQWTNEFWLPQAEMHNWNLLDR